MDGSLNDILPEPISKRNEEVILDLLKRKMKSAVGVTVALLRAMENRFGAEARQVVKDMLEKREPRPRPDAGDPRKDLHDFCERLDRGCCGSHKWRRVIDEPEQIGYHFTRCMWAEIYNDLGEPELGFYLCAGDEPSVKSYNPKLGFRRTKVLMNGDKICDHIFLVEK